MLAKDSRRLVPNEVRDEVCGRQPQTEQSPCDKKSNATQPGGFFFCCCPHGYLENPTGFGERALLAKDSRRLVPNAVRDEQRERQSRCEQSPWGHQIAKATARWLFPYTVCANFAHCHTQWPTYESGWNRQSPLDISQYVFEIPEHFTMLLWRHLRNIQQLPTHRG